VRRNFLLLDGLTGGCLFRVRVRPNFDNVHIAPRPVLSFSCARGIRAARSLRFARLSLGRGRIDG